MSAPSAERQRALIDALWLFGPTFQYDQALAGAPSVRLRVLDAVEQSGLKGVSDADLAWAQDYAGQHPEVLRNKTAEEVLSAARAAWNEDRHDRAMRILDVWDAYNSDRRDERAQFKSTIQKDGFRKAIEEHRAAKTDYTRGDWATARTRYERCAQLHPDRRHVYAYSATLCAEGEKATAPQSILRALRAAGQSVVRENNAHQTTPVHSASTDRSDAPARTDLAPPVPAQSSAPNTAPHQGDQSPGPTPEAISDCGAGLRGVADLLRWHVESLRSTHYALQVYEWVQRTGDTSPLANLRDGALPARPYEDVHELQEANAHVNTELQSWGQGVASELVRTQEANTPLVQFSRAWRQFHNEPPDTTTLSTATTARYISAYYELTNHADAASDHLTALSRNAAPRPNATSVVPVHADTASLVPASAPALHQRTESPRPSPRH